MRDNIFFNWYTIYSYEREGDKLGMLNGTHFQMARTYIYSASILAFIFTEIFHWNDLQPMVSLFSILAILLSLHKAGRIASSLSVLFLCLGFYFLWKQHAGFFTLFLSFGGMLNLLTLFTIIPLISIPIRVGGYNESIRTVLQQKIGSSSQLYRMISLYSFFLSTFMNLATLPMMYYSVQDTVKTLSIRQPKRYMSQAIIHGFAIPTLWTPVAPIVGVVFDFTHVKWIKLFPILLFISVAALLIDWGLYRLNHRHFSPSLPSLGTFREVIVTTPKDVATYSKKKLYQMGFFVFLFIALVIAGQMISSIGLMDTIILFTLPYSLLWALFLRKGKSFIKETGLYFQEKLPAMNSQFAVFLSAGFFVTALQTSGTNQTIAQWVLDLHGFLGTELFLVVLPFLPLLFAYAGMHPALAISLLATAFNPTILGISPECLSVALLGGAVATFMLGPFNATTGIMSNIISVDSFQISRWNVTFCMGFLFLVSVALFLL
jgi:hypothetical protein